MPDTVTYDENPSKIFFFRTEKPLTLKGKAIYGKVNFGRLCILSRKCSNTGFLRTIKA